MAHHIYQTEGIVLGSIPVGESNRFLFLFTKDLGLVGASAQGVRELKSKLRYSLQDLSYSTFDLVRGKEVWRVVNAEKQWVFPCTQGGAQQLAARIAWLLRRLCAGEGLHEELFNDVVSGLVFLRDEEMDKEDLRLFEAAMNINVLHHLGYWGEEKEFSALLGGVPWNRELFDMMRPRMQHAVRAINQALRESHL